MANCIDIQSPITQCATNSSLGPINMVEIDEANELVYVWYKKSPVKRLYGTLMNHKKTEFDSGYELMVFVALISENKHVNGQKAVIKGFFHHNDVSENATSQTILE